MKSNEKYFIGKVVTIIVVTLFVIWFVSFVLGSCKFHEQIGDPNNLNLTILLSFIGILATFVVIGNYAQVSDIRRSTEQDLDKKKNDIDALNSQVCQLKKEVEELSAKLAELNGNIPEIESVIKERSEEDRLYAFNEIQKESSKIQRGSKNTKRLLLSSILSFYDKTGAVLTLLDKLSKCKETDTFSIGIKNRKNKQKVTVRILDDSISFYRGNQQVASRMIENIDDAEITVSVLKGLYQLYRDILVEKSPQDYSNMLVSAGGQGDPNGSDDSFNKNKPE